MHENDRTAYTIYRNPKGNLYPSLAGFYCLGSTESDPIGQFDMFAVKPSTFETTDYGAGVTCGTTDGDMEKLVDKMMINRDLRYCEDRSESKSGAAM